MLFCSQTIFFSLQLIIFVLDSNLPKVRPTGNSVNGSHVSSNVTVSVQRLDIQWPKNAKSKKLCIIFNFCWNNVSEGDE